MRTVDAMVEHKILTFTLGCVLTLLASRARGAVLLFDDFDSYADTAAFAAAWPAVTGGGGDISGFRFQSPLQSVHIGPIPGTQRSGRDFMETSTLATSGNLGIGDQVIFSFDFFDEEPSLNPYRQFATLQDSPNAALAANQLIALGLNNNETGAASGGQFYMARILGHNLVSGEADPDGGPPDVGTMGTNPFFKLNDFGVGVRSEGWHNLKVVISTDDGASSDYEFYVDNQLAERVSNIVGAAGSERRSYDHVRIGSGITATNQAWFDNVKVEFIPAVIPGDFNADSQLDLTDYLILSANLHADMSGMTVEQSYALGDFTRDRLIDGRDFVAFRTQYDVFNGVGAFVALVNQVPEPATGVLGAAAMAALARRRWSRSA